MAASFKSWLSANWYSLIGLSILAGGFYVGTAKTEWRVDRLEKDTADIREDQLSTATTVAEIKGTLAVIVTEMKQIGADVKEVKADVKQHLAGGN